MSAVLDDSSISTRTAEAGLAYTIFAAVNSNAKQEMTTTWPELAQSLRTVQEYPAKDSQPLLKLATFGDALSSKGLLRHDANVVTVTGIEGDYDAKEITVAEAIRRLEVHGVRATIYTSASHTAEAPRWRVLAPLSEPCPPEARAALVARLNGALGGILARESFALSHSYFVGRVAGVEYECADTFDDPEDGTCIDQIDELDEIAIGRRTAPAREADAPGAAPTSGAVPKGLPEWLRELIVSGAPEGKRSDQFYKAVRKLGELGHDGAAIERILGGHPAGIAQKYLGRLRDEIERALSKEERAETPERAAQHAGQPPRLDANNMVNLLCADEIAIEPIRWLWDGYLAAGKLHILAGAPGVAKTTLTLALAATVSTGGYWPDGTRAQAGNVLLWSGEDDPADTLIPRLRAMGANLSRIAFIDTATELDNDNNVRTVAFDPARHMLGLHTRLQSESCALLIVDPIVSAVSGDDHKNASVRRDLQSLVDLARINGVATIGITHFTKGSAGREPVERLVGSLAYGALARIVFVAAKGNDGSRVFIKAKANITTDEGGFQYDVEQVAVPGYPDIFASRINWGQAIEGNAREALASAEEPEQQEHGPTATDEATDMLRDVLKEGEIRAKEATATMKAAGFTEKVIRMARERLGVKTRREGFGAACVHLWSLPPPVDLIASHRCPDTPQMPSFPSSEIGASVGIEGICGEEATP